MRIYSLDAARGIAAIGVILFHVYSGRSFFNHFFLFVDFFFVLSGFVLAPSINSLSNTFKMRKFLRNRFVRLFPMAYSALLFVIFIQLIVNIKYRIMGEDLFVSIPLDPITVLASFLFLQVFSLNSQLLLYPLWSLSSEWLTNLLASSVYFSSAIKKIQLFLLLGVAIIGISLAVNESPRLQICTNQVGRGLLGFGLGLLAWEYRQLQTINLHKSTLILIVVISPLFAFYLNGKSSNVAVYVSPLMFTFVVYSLNILETKFHVRPPVVVCKYLGRISYGLYVWHVIATNIVALASKNFDLQALEPGEFLGIPRLSLVLFITIVFSEIVLKLIEAPIRRKLTYV